VDQLISPVRPITELGQAGGPVKDLQCPVYWHDRESRAGEHRTAGRDESGRQTYDRRKLTRMSAPLAAEVSTSIRHSTRCRRLKLIVIDA
jgi:hypothetical protein